MPYSRLLFKDQARQRILSGATALADAVRVTWSQEDLSSREPSLPRDGRH